MLWGALLLVVLFAPSCTIYHYVDTCTRSQLLLKSYNQEFELPTLETKDWRCNQPPPEQQPEDSNSVHN